MDLYTRIGMYLFLTGALVAIFASVFPVNPSLIPFIMVFLVFSGVFSGLLNISEDEERGFLISGGVLIITMLALDRLFGLSFPIEINGFIRNLTVFVGSMLLVVAGRRFIETASQSEVTQHRQAMRDYSTSRQVWQFIVFIAVALTFVILMLHGFLYSEMSDGARALLLVLDWIIILIFIADVVLLYRDYDSFGLFLRHCWPDVVAAIPLQMSIFGIFKIVRVARVLRVARMVRFGRLTHTVKFLGEHAQLPPLEEKKRLSPKRTRRK